jgi:hypothetical protein
MLHFYYTIRSLLLPTNVYVFIFLYVLTEKSGFFVYVPPLHMFTSHMLVMFACLHNNSRILYIGTR